MSGKSAVHAGAVLAWLTGTAFPAPPATLYLGLFFAAPGADGTGGVEFSGGTYARFVVTFGAPSGVPRQVVSLTDVYSSVASPGWGAIASVGLFDVASGGIPRYFGPLTVPVTILGGEQLKFPAGSIIVREA